MRDCLVCGTPASVPGIRGPATCPLCRRAKYLIVKRRYQRSLKGIATARARETREDVREKRRIFSRSLSGRRNKAKYETTPKGQTTRAKAIARYRASPKAKQGSARRHRLTKDIPARMAQRRKANRIYKRSPKGKALSRRQHAQRKGAILSTIDPLTAQDWLLIIQRHKARCYYCKEKKKLTMDHVIPLSKGGTHTKTNVVPACSSCNSKKRNKILTLF